MTSASKPQGAIPARQGDVPLVIDFEDNRLLQALFGEYDRNLARIEQRLDVVLTPRGNRLAVSGPEGARSIAHAVLNSLYARLQGGLEVAQGDVDGAIRVAEQAAAAGQLERAGEIGELLVRTRKRVISPRSQVQAEYIQAIHDSDLVFGLGPAGTGKTYLAAAVAVSMLMAGQVDRIILSRPAVEAGERLGFLPGDMREKVDPYLRPLYDALYDMMPGDKVAARLETGEIEVAPLAFMRGRTLGNAFVILDEAQNTTPVQMKMLLTRLGENSRMVVTGDLSQVDLPGGVQSGLREAVGILEGVEGAAVVRFTDADVVRHPMVTRVVRAYDAFERKKKAGKADGEPS
jgi:phosphate starvation-inducible PhoH-like protein